MAPSSHQKTLFEAAVCGCFLLIKTNEQFCHDCVVICCSICVFSTVCLLTANWANWSRCTIYIVASESRISRSVKGKIIFFHTVIHPCIYTANATAMFEDIHIQTYFMSLENDVVKIWNDLLRHTYVILFNNQFYLRFQFETFFANACSNFILLCSLAWEFDIMHLCIRTEFHIFS